MLGSERHVSSTAVIPLDRLLTETDGPFTKTGERPSRPADVGLMVEALGWLHGMAASAVAAATRANLRALLEPP